MPRGLILAAPASGSGKTTITLGLLRLCARQGLAVAGAKAGPDYIDPGFHAAASGRPALNLDAWAMRGETIGRLIDRHVGADIVLCEGTMGLFDGAGRHGDRGSTADLAALTGWPVILVVDAQGQSASVAALLQGFAGHRADITLAGVIFNRVGSQRHAEMLGNAVARHVPGLPVLGFVARDAAIAVPSRHLGLVLAPEHAAIDAFLDRAADLMAGAIDLEGLLALARPAPIAAGRLPSPFGQRIAVARDDAFAFIYPHLLAGWRDGGADVSFFSPLGDEGPAGDADAVFLPGGYPELHAGAIAAAGRFRQAMTAAAARGATIYGECGGYMALGAGLIDAEGRRHAMLGLLPVSTSMQGAMRKLGYRQALGLAGPWQARHWRGHEFHFAQIVESGDAPALWRVSDADGLNESEIGHALGSVSGSFLHVIDTVGVC
jgi:cobyrinic acid a,c-diamide synthase